VGRVTTLSQSDIEIYWYLRLDIIMFVAENFAITNQHEYVCE
jgi:hypothetical protein